MKTNLFTAFYIPILVPDMFVPYYMVLSIVASELPSWISALIGAKEAAINPSENGHEYIKTQILDALNITYDGLLGDVNLDGKVNALDATQILRYCNMKPSTLDR